MASHAEQRKHGRALYRRRRRRARAPAVDVLPCTLDHVRFQPLVRAAYHESAHATLAVIHHLGVQRVWIRDDGAGAIEYSRQFVGTGEVEAWVTTTFRGIEAEVDRFGDASQGGDLA